MAEEQLPEVIFSTRAHHKGFGGGLQGAGTGPDQLVGNNHFSDLRFRLPVDLDPQQAEVGTGGDVSTIAVAPVPVDDMSSVSPGSIRQAAHEPSSHVIDGQLDIALCGG